MIPLLSGRLGSDQRVEHPCKQEDITTIGCYSAIFIIDRPIRAGPIQWPTGISHNP